MKNIRFAILLFVTSAALPQSLEVNSRDAAQLRSLINDKGGTCSEVTGVRVAGRLESGDVMVVVSCADGNRHVVRYLKTTQSPVYYMKCGAFLNTVDCG